MTFVVTGESVFNEANFHSCDGLSAKWPPWALASEHLVPRLWHCLERLWAFGMDVWPDLLWLILFYAIVMCLACSYLHCLYLHQDSLGLKMWAEGKLSHLSCFCQMICHNEKSNNYFSHLDTGKHAAPSCCALWLGEMVGHFPTSEYGWSFLLQSRRTGGSHAVQT